MSSLTLSALIQGFFTDRLTRQLRASANTVEAYRDTFRLLLQFAEKSKGLNVSRLLVEHIDAALVTDFLEHLEKVRGNAVRTRNARLAALRSFFRYVAIRDPARMHLSSRIIAIPEKRHERRPVSYLERHEAEAIVAAASGATWLGRRDRALLVVAMQCGLRVSELIQLRREDVVTGRGAHLRCMGKRSKGEMHTASQGHRADARRVASRDQRRGSRSRIHDQLRPHHES
ncbi:MAG: integrase [Myxococcaceae bacterium]|nr:integrase [Myxococcaceae bacterium]